MAVPMTWIDDRDPARRYFCPGCLTEVPLDSYRLLYRGTRRPLRCRSCEVDAAPPAMRAYYLGRFETTRVTKAAYAARCQGEIRVYKRQWDAAHAEDQREWKRGYYLVNRAVLNRQTTAHYWRRRDEIGERSRRRYAETYRTPEARAARVAEREEKARRRRAAFRRFVLTRVARWYGADEPDALCAGPDLTPPLREARAVALYVTVCVRKARDRQPMEEIAADYRLTAQGVRAIVTRVRTRARRPAQHPDAQEAKEVLGLVVEALRRRQTHGKALSCPVEQQKD